MRPFSPGITVGNRVCRFTRLGPDRIFIGKAVRNLLGEHDGNDVLVLREQLLSLLYHALRREELCKLKVRDFRQARCGVPHLKVAGKGEKTRYLPLHPGTNEFIHGYLEAATNLR